MEKLGRKLCHVCAKGSKMTRTQEQTNYRADSVQKYLLNTNKQSFMGGEYRGWQRSNQKSVQEGNQIRKGGKKSKSNETSKLQKT